MADSFDDVTCTGFALGADHGSPLTNAAQGFTKVAATADEGNFEIVFINVMGFIGRGEHL